MFPKDTSFPAGIRCDKAVSGSDEEQRRRDLGMTRHTALPVREDPINNTSIPLIFGNNKNISELEKQMEKRRDSKKLLHYCKVQVAEHRGLWIGLGPEGTQANQNRHIGFQWPNNCGFPIASCRHLLHFEAGLAHFSRPPREENEARVTSLILAKKGLKDITKGACLASKGEQSFLSA
ncbi:uncharacterized protein EI90DRAFT_3013287 [Cantharellus anzutake]|uniref:uncharacterized protein n=1 Tax=Cantharellus anzutake TaxID=1750568 RepID=UPI00190306FF|nr:uncharacterized protein EI90DRAFT_3013287 [Cantharellus anzutake]KAF8337921.1 hypothetical protein EI90DRAFT_3013287 [Cantharellus anzutake]